MAKKDLSFYEYLRDDVFSFVPDITSKPMFGGWGFYKDGIIFGIVADGKIYFKVGELNKKDYIKKGSKPFTYPMKNGKTTTLSYWELPEDILENKNEIEDWINKSTKESLQKKK